MPESGLTGLPGRCILSANATGARVMQIYLPIAEVSVNAFTLIGLGGLVGGKRERFCHGLR